MGTTRPRSTGNRTAGLETDEQAYSLAHSPAYSLADYLAESNQFHVLRAVHVQSEVSSARALQDARVQQILANTPGSGGMPNAIVAYSDLSDPGTSDHIDNLMQYANLRGVRSHFQTNDRWLEHTGLLQQHNLSCDLELDPKQMRGVVDLANRYPDIPVILSLHGYLSNQQAHNESQWQDALNLASCCNNISIKVAGLRIGSHQTADYGQALVSDIINRLGTDRLMFAGHFPIDRQHGTYDELWQWYCDITARASARDRDKLFRSNAVRIYRL